MNVPVSAPQLGFPSSRRARASFKLVSPELSGKSQHSQSKGRKKSIHVGLEGLTNTPSSDMSAAFLFIGILVLGQTCVYVTDEKQAHSS